MMTLDRRIVTSFLAYDSLTTFLSCGLKLLDTTLHVRISLHRIPIENNSKCTYLKWMYALMMYIFRVQLFLPKREFAPPSPAASPTRW